MKSIEANRIAPDVMPDFAASGAILFVYVP